MAINVKYYNLTIDGKNVKFPVVTSSTPLTDGYLTRNFSTITTLVYNYNSNQPNLTPLTKNTNYSINGTNCYINVTNNNVILKYNNSTIITAGSSYGRSYMLAVIVDPNHYYVLIPSIATSGSVAGNANFGSQTASSVELVFIYDVNNEKAAKEILISVGVIKTKYSVTLNTPTHGTAQADKTEAESGETVVITTTPENGYNLSFGSSGTKIIDGSGNEITPTLYTPTSFGFVMPDSDVTVTCVFISGNPYLPGGTSTPETPGAQGDFDNHSDIIPIPTTPDINYSDSGLVRLFSPSQANIIDFGNYLWTGLLNFDNIIKAFANPMDSLISFHKVPFSVNTGSSIAVKFAGISTGVVMPPVTQQLYEIDCGTLQFPRYYGSAFDYSPYSKAKIYLPYIGEIPLNIDRLIGKTIGVKYKADCYSGTLVAYMTIDDQVYIQQAGSCLLPIPISMNNYQQLVTGGFNLLAGAVSSVPQIGAGFGSNPMTSIASTALTAVKPASDLLQSAFGKPETGSSALGGGIAGYLGVQYPYVTITRPKQSLASSFNSMYGYPLNVTDYPQSYKGFVKISDITLTDTTATTQERNEIYRLLHDGIVIYENTPPEYTDSGQNLKIVFEKFTGRQNAVNKNITTVLEMTGTFRDYQSVINPVIRVQGDILNVINNSNMICIPRLKRRYFIDNITTNTNISYEISLRCDVLESFWNSFKGNLAIIERAESMYNLELNDNLFVAEQKPLFQQLRFPNGFTTTSYILALSGNNGTGD